MTSLYVTGARNAISIGAGGFFPDYIIVDGRLSQEGVDNTINSIYTRRLGWSALQRKIMNIYKSGVRPSGEYKAPNDFILGLSDGNPVNAMEQIYVLVNNYGWIITFA